MAAARVQVINASGPSGRTRTPWTIEEEHVLDRLYRGEDKVVQDVADILGRTELITRARLTLLYFGREGATESRRDPQTWCAADDARLKDFYDARLQDDRDEILYELCEVGHKAWWVAARLLEIIPRSHICLFKARQLGQSLDSLGRERSVTDSALGTLSTTSLHDLRARLPVMNTFGRTFTFLGTRVLRQDHCLFVWSPADTLWPPARFREHRELFPFRLVVCSLGLLWEDELRGLCQIALAHHRIGAVARRILACLALPPCLATACSR